MADIETRPIKKADVGPLAKVLARAFYDDPVMRYMVPDDKLRARALPPMFAAMTRHHFYSRGGSEVATRDGTIGAATLWDPPGQRRSSRWEELRMMPTMVFYLRSCAERYQVLNRAMEEAHPHEPHWYLMVIGSDPTVRGAGFGQALMRSRLDRCDGERVPAYLEATKEELLPYYMRFGFEQIGEIALPDGPKMWPMWRVAR
ncbi:GNAT family N-acetyltransferase [Mycolicibacterium agri]|uniref:GCN5-like N-acetyltransferase n=2 Tax=Mycolicibacterium agri TaxID=36811 RepID=A0A7I9VZM1_MYCAG|nr:GNAT family N-acetyltransferase [Mycolicibacterium agri]GFG50895.1 GCN5-like N-acetyltransferase [Mycolicibacterium agri]